MYKDLLHVPEAVSEFYYEETVSEPTGGFTEELVEGPDGPNTIRVPTYIDVIYLRRKSRPQTKSMQDLERVGAKGRLTVIRKFADLVAAGQLWDWFDSYNNWEQETLDILEFNSEGMGTEEQPFVPKELPVEPIQPAINADVLYDSYVRSVFKAARTSAVARLTVDVGGMVFDGDEISQGRMARAILVMSDEDLTLWVLADNTAVQVDKDILMQALRLAGEAQTDLWIEGA